MDDHQELAGDLLWGAEAIALDLFGKADEASVRRVYHLHANKRLPTWRDYKNGPILSRRSLLQQHFVPPAAVIKKNA
jgi:hypothetical protein